MPIRVPHTPLSWDPVDPKKIWHMVYGAPDVSSMSQTVHLSKTRSAGYVYVTNDVLANPYDELPATGATDTICWPTSTDPSICADYLLENERLYHYSGVGTDWE